ncbi:c-type cytochrome [Rhodopseudomonas palustris]|uniref:c-type cytochrome n=2 Tax=Rhodopseudomonas TaxID=1073 RepID=UPI003CC8232E
MLIVAGQTVIARANGETPVPDVDSINSGRAIYEQHCASCHGANAEGAPNWQERDARGELPAPPHNAEGHTWRQLRCRSVRDGEQGLARSVQQV